VKITVAELLRHLEPPFEEIPMPKIAGPGGFYEVIAVRRTRAGELYFEVEKQDQGPKPKAGRKR